MSALALAVLVFACLLGSIPSAYLVGRWVKGIDLRQVGSGTLGSSNVYYHVGKFWLFVVGIFDMFGKGSGSVLLARAFDLPLAVQAAAGLLAVVGHNWGVFLRFQGGRGVAPTVGVLLVLARPELVLFIITGTAGWRLTGSSAVWVLAGFVLMPLAALGLGQPIEEAGLLAGVLAVTVIKRLTANSLRGTGVPLRTLLLNRLVFDRDIADHDAWVRRTATREAPRG
ncbi:MAG: glycerol-3-phosphate acyltransferase [Chloroflexota bacterium]